MYFPTPPPSNATPEAPPLGRSDTLQVAFYRTAGRSSSRPITLRYRLAATHQTIDAVVTAVATGQRLERRRGHDRSITLDADTHFRVFERDVWGSLYVAHTSRSGVPDRRAQNELAYVALPPGWTSGPFLFRTKWKFAFITDRGATTLNVINPYFETVWRHEKRNLNFHLVWSLERTKDGAEGWRTTSQIAVFADWLYVALLKR